MPIGPARHASRSQVYYLGMQLGTKTPTPSPCLHRMLWTLIDATSMVGVLDLTPVVEWVDET